MNNKWLSYHSGNYKSFRSPVPGTKMCSILCAKVPKRNIGLSFPPSMIFQGSGGESYPQPRGSCFLLPAKHCPEAEREPYCAPCSDTHSLGCWAGGTGCKGRPRRSGLRELVNPSKVSPLFLLSDGSLGSRGRINGKRPFCFP